MLVVGIDPGAYKTGFAWVSEKNKVVTRGTLTILSGGSELMRYPGYLKQLTLAFASLQERPDAIAIEEPDRREKWLRRPEDIHSMAHLEGVYAITVAEIFRLWPAMKLFSWKTLVWRGVRADKSKTMDRMGRKYEATFETDDESDALAIADHALGIMKGPALGQTLGLLEEDEDGHQVRMVQGRTEISKAETGPSAPAISNFKSLLMEHAQRLHLPYPNYRVIREEGFGGNMTFHVMVSWEGREHGPGSGRTKKQAEQLAAKAALLDLGILREATTAAIEVDP